MKAPVVQTRVCECESNGKARRRRVAPDDGELQAVKPAPDETPAGAARRIVREDDWGDRSVGSVIGRVRQARP